LNRSSESDFEGVWKSMFMAISQTYSDYVRGIKIVELTKNKECLMKRLSDISSGIEYDSNVIIINLGN